jgi:CRP-like cAMP-binding protein
MPTACTSTFDPRAFLATLKAGRSAARFAKDAVVYNQAAIADGVYYLQEGRIKISVASRQGKDAIIGILEPGAFFGEGCLIGQDRRSASAVAMVESKVMRVGKAEMLRLMHEEPAFDELFIQHLLTRNRRVEEDLVDQLFNSSEKRLARALLLLANVQPGGLPQRIATRMSQETLAELIGTTRPRVSHFMAKFRNLGFISGAAANLRVDSSLASVVVRESAL